MHQVDYQLGLDAAEDFDNAAGAGALLVACNTKCQVAHPFSKTKRLACKSVCEQKYAVRQETGQTFGVNKTIAAAEQGSALAQAEAIAAEAEAAELAKAGLTTKSASTDGGSEEKKAGLGTGAMIGIGVGVLVLVVGIVLITRKK